jgi:hypothetical protein
LGEFRLPKGSVMSASSIAEKVVAKIERTPPLIPLAAAFVWGCALAMLSFAMGLARFCDPTTGKLLGWSYEINWFLTFGFWIPLSLYFCSSVVTSIPQTIASLSRRRMIRAQTGEPVDLDTLLSAWKRRATSAVKAAFAISLVGLAASWALYVHSCVIPTVTHGLVPVHGWHIACSLSPSTSGPIRLFTFGFIAFTSQAAAIAIFVLYMLIVVAFASWIFEYTTLGTTDFLYPDLHSNDRRLGFEKFELLIENLLWAAIAFFFQLFMVRLDYVFLDDKSSTSIYDFVGRLLWKGFGSDVVHLVHGDPTLFQFGGLLYFVNTLDIMAFTITVITAALIPAVIVRQAAIRSKEQLETVLEESPERSQQWFGMDPATAKKRLNSMVVWPLNYVKPVNMLLIVLLSFSCFIFYKLTIILLGMILAIAVRFLLKAFGSTN